MTSATKADPLIWTFFGLVFALSVPFWLLDALSAYQLMPGLPLAAFMVVCPAAAALILAHRADPGGGARALIARAIDAAKVRPIIGWAPILLVVPFKTVAVFVIQRWTGALVPAPSFAIAPAAGLMALFIIAALAEELGWSGYATAPLQARLGPLGGALALGVIWAAFHWVALVQVGRSLEWIAWWSLGTIAVRVIMVWIFVHTGRSVFAVALIHAHNNLAWQLYPVRGSWFDPRIDGLVGAGFAVLIVLVWRPRAASSPPAP